jgi:bacterioferritin (cytochrome b1)
VDAIRQVKTRDDVLRYLNVALVHEWAVSFEYLFHAYSMPKGKHFYEDPVSKMKTDVRGQTIQIGIDEMYHALQLGIVVTQMGGVPSFKTDEVARFPRILDNLARDQKTEDLVTDLYQGVAFPEGEFPKVQNMIWNISTDEVRHSRQFTAMMDALFQAGQQDARCFPADPEAAARPEVRLLHELTVLENELMHRYLKLVILFSEHQDLSQRLFKNSINHMRHWDKLAGCLVKLGDVIRIENAARDADGVERSVDPMPALYPGENRPSALKTLPPAEEALAAKYEAAIGLLPDGEVKDQIRLHLGLTREHIFTVDGLLKNARKIKGVW